MVDFAGWSMPVQYSSIVTEHTATRTRAALFDISHMGRLRFDGTGVATFLDALVTRRVTDLKPGFIRYSLMTNEAGGILDDILIYHLRDAAGGSYYLVVVNASNRQKIVDWLTPRVASAPNVRMADVTFDWSMIAVQGPQALDLVQPLVDVPLKSMKYYSGVECRIGKHSGIVSRTGYTGEDGCELIVGNRTVESIWQTLFDAGAVPAGLGSRDTLRLEAAMPLYGHELSEEINPLEAGLDFAVNLENRNFVGSDALRRYLAGPRSRQRVGLELTGKRVAREGDTVVVADREVGRITSGTFSPTFNKPIAMAYVDPEHSSPSTPITVSIRGKSELGMIVPLPFYQRKK